MIYQKLNFLSERLAKEYAGLVSSWKIVFWKTVTSDRASTARLKREITQSAIAFLENARFRFGEDIRLVSIEARKDTLAKIKSIETQEAEDRLLQHLTAISDYLIDELTAQISRDIASVLKKAQSMILEVELESRITDDTITFDREVFQDSFSLTTRDRGGSKWSSEKFIRTLWRQSLLSAYNETVLVTLSDHGIDRALVEHPDEKSRHSGIVVTMTSSKELPHYSEIRETVFHPNSDANLTWSESLV